MIQKILIASILFFGSLGFGLESNVKSVFVEDNKTSGKQYLVILGGSKLLNTESLIIFGDKEKKKMPHLRSFHMIGTTIVEDYDKGKGEAADNFYHLTYAFHEKGDDADIDVVLKGTKGKTKKPIKLHYTKTTDKAAIKKAETVAAGFYKQLEAISKIAHPKTIGEFRKMMDQLVSRTTGGFDGDAGEFPLPWSNLQIESQWHTTEAKGEVAEAKIESDGKDAISKLVKVHKWLTEKEVPEEEAMKKDKEYPYYQLKADRFKEAPFKAGAKTFVRYEIIKASAFDCEGDNNYQEEITWVLADGSTYTYVPVQECD